jgi:hypothetical protein
MTNNTTESAAMMGKSRVSTSGAMPRH